MILFYEAANISGISISCWLVFLLYSFKLVELVENGLKPPVAEKVEDFIADSDIDSHDTVFTEFSYQKNSEKLMELGFDSDLSEQTNSADSKGQFQDLIKLQQEAINGNLSNKSQQNTLSNNEDSREMPTGEFVRFLETEDSAEESQTKESLVSLEQSFKQDNADIKVDSAIERSKVEEQGIPGLKDSTMLSMADESEEKVMTEEKESKLEEKIDTLTKVVFELKGSIDSNSHGADIKDLKNQLRELDKKHSMDVCDLYNVIRKHESENHSSKNSRDAWVAIAVIGCTIATFLSPFIQKWLG